MAYDEAIIYNRRMRNSTRDMVHSLTSACQFRMSNAVLLVVTLVLLLYAFTYTVICWKFFSENKPHPHAATAAAVNISQAKSIFSQETLDSGDVSNYVVLNAAVKHNDTRTTSDRVYKEDINDPAFRIPLVHNRTYAVSIYVRTIDTEQERNLRFSIRETWGRQAVELGMFVAFCAAITKDKDVKASLKSEMDRFGDIIIFDTFFDHYYNLSLKTRDEMRYDDAHRPRDVPTIHILNNNDVLLFPERIIDYIDSRRVNESRDTIFGYCSCYGECREREGPTASRVGKWAIPKSVYPYERYPHYCFGFTLMFGPGCTEALVSVANNKTDQWLMQFGFDDVTYAGLLRMEAGLRTDWAPFAPADMEHGRNTLGVHLETGVTPDATMKRLKEMWELEKDL